MSLGLKEAGFDIMVEELEIGPFRCRCNQQIGNHTEIEEITRYDDTIEIWQDFSKN